MIQSSAAASRAPILVLGLGNILLEDEGLGVHALRLLCATHELPKTIECMDGGTAGMALIDAMVGRERLLVIDAVTSDSNPGSLVELSGEQVPAYLRTLVSPHEIGLVDVLGVMAMANQMPSNLHLIGITPQSMELSLQLSTVVNKQLTVLVERIVLRLREWGCDVRCREVSEQSSTSPLAS